MFIREIILNKLREVIHPKGGGSIVTQGLVKAINLSDQKMEIILRLRSEDRDVRKLLHSFILECLNEYEKNYIIKVRFERSINKPQRGKSVLDRNSSGAFQKLAICSTNEGIEKTSFALNLAIALSKMDYRVGLLDADLYGPDLASILGNDQRPFYINKKVFLFESFGICMLTLRQLMENKSFVNWRGSCVNDSFQQIFNELNSERLNLVLFNLPPGVGDAQIALLQGLSFDGAVIVTGTQAPLSQNLNKMIRIIRDSEIPLLGVLEDTSYLDRDLNYIPWDQKHKSDEIKYLGNIPLNILSSSTLAEITPDLYGDETMSGSFSFSKIAGKISNDLFH